MTQVTRPVLRYFGGKFLLAPWIISLMPEHRTYVEPYGGGGSVLMLKPPAPYAEIYNDLDGEIVNVFRVLRDEPEDLMRCLELTPWSREEFSHSHEPSESAVEWARRTIVRSHMGFADATTGPKHAGFRAVMSQGKPAAKVWAGFPSHVETFAKRLSGVVIENRDARHCIEEHDSPDTLFLIDPPYVHATRTSKNNYRHEMSDEDHASLCLLLTGLQGMVILCGYENEIYAGLNWKMISRSALADGARSRTECLWLNPAAVSRQKQKELFA